MKNLATVAFFGLCVACCVTGSSAFFGKLIKIPKFKDIVKTIGIPITIPPPFLGPVPPRIPDMRTTTTTTPPPPTTLPPTPSTLHPDDITIALCNEAMSACPWSPDELVAKIIERQNVDSSIEYNGKGKSVGPTVNPSKVGDKLKPEIGRTESPSLGKGIRGGDKGKVGGGVPEICLPFGKKHRDPIAYFINCIGYLSDTTIPNYANRRNAMLGCFKCRYLCELGGTVQYL